MNNSIKPKYIFVANYLKDQLRSGNYRVGEILPGERKISENLNMSRPTVKRAIALLEKQGIIKCNASIGSVIIKLPVEKLLLGYITPDLQDPFHLELIQELDMLIHGFNGALIVLQGTDESRLIAAGATHAVKHHMLYEIGVRDRIPTVYTGNVSGEVCQIVSDIQSGMDLLLHHLIDLGHTNIAYVSPFQEKDDYQIKSLMDSSSITHIKIANRNKFIIDPLNISSIDLLIKKLKNNSKAPTALICYNDWLAISLMKSFRRHGINIPGDISITGYDNLNISSLLYTPLTTISFSRKETAKKIINMLFNYYEDTAVRSVVDTKLIIRESTEKLN